MSTCAHSPSRPQPPERTLYMRPLPTALAALDSAAGRATFQRALVAGTLDGYFKLAQQLHTQADPAFCGLGSLVCALNALGIDPGRRAARARIETFREDLLAAATASDGPVLIVNYSRSAVGQTGTGHFSPIGGYDAATDQALVLDTARFKYPPHWMPVALLFAAMQERDADTGDTRGWMLLDQDAASVGMAA